MVDSCQFHIRLLPIFKAFDLKIMLLRLVEDNRRLRRDGSHPQRPYGRALSKLPAPARSSIALGDQKATNAGLLTQRPFAGIQAPPDADLVFAFCPKLDAAPCPVRVLPQDLSPVATPVTACISLLSNISLTGSYPNALPRRHAPLLFKGSLLGQPKTDRMLLLLGRSMHIFPCPQSFIGYVLAHGTPTALFMARQNVYIIINDTCSYRSEGDASRNGS